MRHAASIGIDDTHEDLQGRVLLPGYNALDGSTNTHDGFGHGTHVSGIAAAVTNNGIGIAGTAGQANIQLLPVKVLDDSGSGSDFSVARGIRWATDHGAQIISMSLGGMGYSQTLADAVSYAVSHGVVVVAAAGNSAADVTHFYPASLPGVLAVAATDQYSIAWWSNWGSSIKLTAPGVGILSTIPGNQYQSWSGTSMATPFVSGYAAFLKALHPTYNRFEIAAQMEAQAFKPTGTWDQYYGYGVIDMSAANKAVDFNSWSIQVEAPARGIAVSGETPLVVDVNPRLVGSVQVKDESGRVVANLPNPKGDFLLQGRFDASMLAPGKHTLTFTAYDAQMGALASRSLDLTVRSPNATGLQIKALDPMGRPAKAWIALFHSALYQYQNQDVLGYEWVWSGETNDAGELQLTNALLHDGNDFILYANIAFTGPDGKPAFAWYTRTVSTPGRIVLNGINAHPVTISAQRVKDDGSAVPMDDGYLLGLIADAAGQGEGVPTNAVAAFDSRGTATVWMEPGTYNLAAVSWTYNHFLYQPQVKVSANTRRIDFGVDQVAHLTFAGDHEPYTLAEVSLFNGSNLEPVLDLSTNRSITFTPGYYMAELITVPVAKDNAYYYWLVDGLDPLISGQQTGILYRAGDNRVLHDGTLIEPAIQSLHSYQVPGTDYLSVNKFTTTSNLWLYYGYWVPADAAASVSESMRGPLVQQLIPGQAPSLIHLGIPGQVDPQQIDMDAMDAGFIEPTFTVTGADGTTVMQNVDFGNLWNSLWHVPGTQTPGLYLGQLDLGNVGPLGGPVHTETGIDVRKDGVTSGIRLQALGLDGKPTDVTFEVLHRTVLPDGQPFYDWNAFTDSDANGMARLEADPALLPDGGQYVVLAYHGDWDAVTPPFLLMQTITSPADVIFDARQAQTLTVTMQDEHGNPLGWSSISTTAQDAAGTLIDSFYSTYTDGNGHAKLLVTPGANYVFTGWAYDKDYLLTSPTVKVTSNLTSYTIPADKLARVTVGQQTLPSGQAAPYGYFYPLPKNTYVWGAFSQGETITLSAGEYELQDLVIATGVNDLWAYWFDTPSGHLSAGDTKTFDFGGPLSGSLSAVQSYANKGQFFAYTDVRDSHSNPLISEIGWDLGSGEADLFTGKTDLAHVDLAKLNRTMREFKEMYVRRQLALALGPAIAQRPQLPEAQTHTDITPNLRIYDRSGRLVTTVHDIDNNWAFLYWAPPAGTGGTFTARMILPVDASTDLTVDAPFRLPGLSVEPGLFSPRNGQLKIHLDLGQTGTVDVQVQRSDGAAVQSLISGRVMAAGSYDLIWDGRSGWSYAPDGDYMVIATVAETGQVLTVPFSLKATVPNRPTLDTPARFSNVASVRLTGRASPGSHIEFWVDGYIAKTADPVDVNGDGYFAGDVPLGADGKHFITAIAYDDYGNRSGYASTVSITLDTVPPDLSLARPAVSSGGSVSTNASYLSLQGTTEGYGTVALSVTRPDGTTVARSYPTGYSGRFQDSITLPMLGDYSFRLVATDQAGNISSAYSFTVHRSAAS